MQLCEYIEEYVTFDCDFTMCLLVLGFSANSFTMPISDFRKKKLLYVFNVFFGKIVF